MWQLHFTQKKGKQEQAMDPFHTPYFFFFFFFGVKRSVYDRQLEKITVKKAQAKVVKCAKNKSWVPRTPPPLVTKC